MGLNSDSEALSSISTRNHNAWVNSPVSSRPILYLTHALPSVIPAFALSLQHIIFLSFQALYTNCSSSWDPSTSSLTLPLILVLIYASPQMGLPHPQLFHHYCTLLFNSLHSAQAYSLLLSSLFLVCPTTLDPPTSWKSRHGCWIASSRCSV